MVEFKRQYYIVIVDSYSNYPGVKKHSNQSSNAVLLAIKATFGRQDIPYFLSDNGPCCSSTEFASPTSTVC